MQLVTVLSSLALAAWGAQAAPSPSGWGNWGGGGWGAQNCLSDADAQAYAADSAIFLSHTNIALANATAQKLFADNIVEYGDSINSLLSEPIGQQVENGKVTYIRDTLSTPPIPTVNTIAVVHDCKHVVWQWEFLGIGSGQYRVRGFTLATFNDAKQVAEQYVEFNGLAWAADIGFTITPPPCGVRGCGN